MKRILVLVWIAAVLTACGSPLKMATGHSSDEELGWLFLGKGPYTLKTRVKAAPGPGSFKLVKDLSLMSDTPDVLVEKEVTVAPDSTLVVALGKLEPGFYQVRLRDTLRWNIGIRPDDVVSAPDAPSDFDAFWESTLKELSAVPMEPVWTLVPEYSDDTRQCFEVRYASLGGATSGGIISIPVAPGKYPVIISYMGYGAKPVYYKPSDAPGRIQFMVSVRDQGLFREGNSRWIDRGITSREEYYYRGAFCDVKRAVDFVASLEKADLTRIVALGGSQGGGFSFVAAALDSRIKAIAPGVPFLGDYEDYARITRWPIHEVMDEATSRGIPHKTLFDMLRYFDAKNLAPRITCPVFMGFGLQDPVCPPHTNFSIYNNLGTKDKRFLCVPTCGHGIWKEEAWKKERATFLEPFLQ